MAAKVTIFTGGNPFSPSGIGSGNTSVSTSVSQTFALTATSQAKFWLAGNGVSSILITSARLIQGAKNVPVIVNGAQSFYIPATGRWSDYVSISDFTLPGNVTLTVTFETTANFPTFTDNSVPEDPVIVSATETSLSGEGLSGEVLFDVDFEGDFIDSVNGLTPTNTTNFSLETNPARVFFGNGSAKFIASQPEESPGSALLVYPPMPAAAIAECLENGFTMATYIMSAVTTPYLPADVWTHMATVCAKDGSNFTISAYYGGKFISSNPVSYEDVEAMLTIQMALYSTSVSGWMDAYQIIKGVVWTEDFTPPSVPFTSTSDTRLVEITLNSTITLAENPSAGDTLVLKGGSGGDVTFTFVDHYPNNSSEIQIGATANDTATNIATAINDIAGAEFTATATGNVITITAYSPTFSMEETGSSLTLGNVIQTHDGLLTEEVSVADSFTASDGGKAVQEEISAADNIDGLIDGLSESVSASDSFDVPLDSINESVSVSTNFDGLIDVMGAT